MLFIPISDAECDARLVNKIASHTIIILEHFLSEEDVEFINICNMRGDDQMPYGKIIKGTLDYNNVYNYEYLIQKFVAVLIPVKFAKEDWENATLEHFTTKNITQTDKEKKFDIDIIVQNKNDKNEMIFTSSENRLTVPLTKIEYVFKICGAVKYIHATLLNIPLNHQENIFSEQYINSLYRSGIQVGICLWLQSNLSNTFGETGLNDMGRTFYNILEEYEEWSNKTYEGAKKTFGFVLDKKSEKEGASFRSKDIKYIDFLQRNEFAPIVDLPCSIIKIDNNGTITKYLSNADNKSVMPYDVYFHPLNVRDLLNLFNRIDIAMKKYISVCLYENSEILIIKDNKLEWVKRNGRWFNYNFDYFVAALKSCNLNLDNNKIKKIFSFILNLSFAKTGGCLALISEENKQKFLRKFNKNNWFDNVQTTEARIEKKLKKCSPDELDFFNLKLKKRHIIKEFVNKKNFFDFDYHLLLEMASMDGATIIKENGDIITSGSIVALETRGEGGGRSAAAKTLSNYGIAIKVSTDGYFEIYKNQKIIYSLK